MAKDRDLKHVASETKRLAEGISNQNEALAGLLLQVVPQWVTDGELPMNQKILAQRIAEKNNLQVHIDFDDRVALQRVGYPIVRKEGRGPNNPELAFLDFNRDDTYEILVKFLLARFNAQKLKEVKNLTQDIAAVTEYANKACPGMDLEQESGRNREALIRTLESTLTMVQGTGTSRTFTR